MSSRAKFELTAKEIADLAAMIGIHVEPNLFEDDESANELITITECPPYGVLNDHNQTEHYVWIAYYSDYPEEGCFPLGDAYDESLAEVDIDQDTM